MNSLRLLDRLVTHPLRRLQRASRNIAAGHFATRLQPGGVKVVGSLSEEFNRMRGELAEHITPEEPLALHDALLESLGEGVCGLDAHGRCTFINSAALAMLGWTREQAIGSHRLLVFRRPPQPHDKSHARASCPIEQTVLDGQRRECEEMIMNSAGEYFPVHLTVTPVRQVGKTTGTILAIRDIRERKQAERALAECEAKYRCLHESMRDAYVLMTLDGHILDSNRAYQEMLGYGAEELRQLTYSQITPEEWHLEETRIILEQVLPMGQSEPYEKQYRHRDGHLFPVELRTFLVHDEQGGPGCMWAIVRDISDRKRIETALHIQATTDLLTGISNRRRFLEQLEQELARLRRYGEATSLLLLEIDHFQRVNESHGRAAGDRVLCHFADLASAMLRRSDLFGRLGSEEFAILLPATDVTGAAEFAERFREFVRENPVMVNEERIACSVSIGVVQLALFDLNPDSVLARADAALYCAREGGRDRVEVAT